MGVVAFEDINTEAGTTEMNYWIGPSQWGNGYAVEGAERLIEYGFNQLNLRKIVAKVASFNGSSMRVVEKIGFTKERIQRQQDFVDGEYQDVHLYGLLKPDWKELNDGI